MSVSAPNAATNGKKTYNIKLYGTQNDTTII